MLRYSLPGALTFMIYQETHTARMTCGSKDHILLLRTMLCFDDCRAWTVLVQTYINIWGGLNPLIPSNTALYRRYETVETQNLMLLTLGMAEAVIVRYSITVFNKNVICACML